MLSKTTKDKKKDKNQDKFISKPTYIHINIHLNQYWATRNKSVLTGEEEEEEEGANL